MFQGQPFSVPFTGKLCTVLAGVFAVGATFIVALSAIVVVTIALATAYVLNILLHLFTLACAHIANMDVATQFLFMCVFGYLLLKIGVYSVRRVRPWLH